MNKNRINRTSTVPTIDRNPQFFIRRSEIAFDERARYVEFVCNVWNEGRFGPDLATPVTINLSIGPEPDPTAFYDLPDDDPNDLMPWDASSPLGRARCQLTENAFQRAKQMELVDAAPNARNSTSALPPNQGRGSP